MRKPSFFIVGAPKCGTTALCKYLDKHPDIFIPAIKELNYFGSDLTGNKKANSLEEYLRFFEGQESKVCGEGTPWYLFSQCAAQEIYDFNPQAKIVIMLRNPVDVLYSLHSQHIFNGSSEDIADFASALAAEPERKLGKRIPRKCIRPEGLLYREVGKFTAQVERYFQVFGRDRVQVILFEDFKANTATIYHETLEFLGVPSDFQTDFVRINANRQVRNPKLQRLIRHPPEKLLSIGKFFVPLPQSVRRSFLETAKVQLKRLNIQQKARPRLDPALRKQLQAEFAPELVALGQLIDKDLSAWSG